MRFEMIDSRQFFIFKDILLIFPPRILSHCLKFHDFFSDLCSILLSNSKLYPNLPKQSSELLGNLTTVD